MWMFTSLREEALAMRIPARSTRLVGIKERDSMLPSRLALFVTAIAAFLFSAQAAPCRSHARIVRAEIQPVGSVPPDDQLSLPCVRKLSEKPYSRAAVRACEQSLQKLSYVQQVKIRKWPSGDGTGRLYVEFEVRAKDLPIEEINFDCAPEDKLPLEEWLKTNPDILRVGAPFSRDEYWFTYQAIKFFYLKWRGRLVGIVPLVDLRFREGTARVSFKIIDGPEVRNKPRTLPQGPNCFDYIVTDPDRYVPLPLIVATIAAHVPPACDSREEAARDQAPLDSLGILESSSVEYGDEPGNRTITYELKGKPVAVADVSIRTYGSADSCLEAARQSLRLKAGEIYLRGDAFESAQNAKIACSQPEMWVEVTETDRLTTDRRLEVIFHVLTFPLHTVLIDGVALRREMLSAP